MIFGNVGVETDPIRLVAIALGDFKNAAGPNGFMERFAQRTTVWIDALQYHRRVANGHEPRALEHMHQGQRAVGRARCGGGTGQDGAVDRRDERHLIADLEHLLDIQRRKAEKAFGPNVVGIEAAVEIADNGFDVPRR